MLQQVRSSGDLEAWLAFFLEGVGATGQEATDTADKTIKLFAKDQSKIEKLGARPEPHCEFTKSCRDTHIYEADRDQRPETHSANGHERAEPSDGIGNRQGDLWKTERPFICLLTVCPNVQRRHPTSLVHTIFIHTTFHKLFSSLKLLSPCPLKTDWRLGGACEHLHLRNPTSAPHPERITAPLLQASDGNSYVTKFQNNPQHIRVLANEMLAMRLGLLLALPMPQVEVIEVSNRLIEQIPDLRIRLAVMTFLAAAASGWDRAISAKALSWRTTCHQNR
ncbi:MAG TPA: hypothetical protein VGF44_15430 [Terriglobales bacterium]